MGRTYFAAWFKHRSTAVDSAFAKLDCFAIEEVLLVVLGVGDTNEYSAPVAVIDPGALITGEASLARRAEAGSIPAEAGAS